MKGRRKEQMGKIGKKYIVHLTLAAVHRVTQSQTQLKRLRQAGRLNPNLIMSS